MPEELERELKKRARTLFPKDENRQRRYVYGTLRRVAQWSPTRARNSR